MLPVSVESSDDVAALQFDLAGFEDHVLIGAPLSTVDGTIAASALMAPGVKRIVCCATGSDPLPASIVMDLPLTLTETAPQGGPVLRVSNIWFAKADGTRISAGPSYGPLTQWQLSVFSPEELEDASITGDDRDPDGDWLSNLMEYAVGGDPKLPDTANLPAFSSVDAGGQPGLRFTYRLSRDHDGATVTPQGSPDLFDWQNLIAVPTGIEDELTVEMQVLTGTDDRQFLRLNVTRTP